MSSVTSAVTSVVGKQQNEKNVRDNFKLPAKTTTSTVTTSRRRKNTTTHARPSQIDAPPPEKQAGLTVNSRLPSVIKPGTFLLGPKQGNSPVKSIEQYLARKNGTDQFYVIKVLTLKDVGEKDTPDDIQGKTLLFTEFSLLSLLRNEDGVFHEHGMFRETTREPFVDANGVESMKEVRRRCLVLDCFVAHDFSPKFSNITNMQCYVIKEKKVPESEAIRIFFKVVQIVERLHKLNIVHRDLKLGNIILNMDSREVKLSNFCLGKHLSSHNDLLKDQRGSPAYISPDVISGKPYLGKPSDMWALGVVLYTMLFGQFPFYDQKPSELFRQIKLGSFAFPQDVNVSDMTKEIVSSLIMINPRKRLTASETLLKVKSVIAIELSLMTDSVLQVVPNCHPSHQTPKKRKFSQCSSSQSDFQADIVYILQHCVEAPEFRSNEACEPKNKKNKGIDHATLPDIINEYTLNDNQLQRIHAIYIAQQLVQAASNGKISAKMISEELTNRINTSTSTQTTSTTTSTNIQSDHQVPYYEENDD